MRILRTGLERFVKTFILDEEDIPSREEEKDLIICIAEEIKKEMEGK